MPLVLFGTELQGIAFEMDIALIELNRLSAPGNDEGDFDTRIALWK